MVKNLKNSTFFTAIDYLFREKMVTNQKELAEKIGISEGSMSRLKNGTKGVSDKTIRSMNEAFGNIFNMQYFRGESPVMLVKDLGQGVDELEKEGTQSLLDLAARLVSEVEQLRRELHAEREQTRLLNAQLTATLQKLESITPSREYLMASEEPIKTK